MTFLKQVVKYFIWLLVCVVSFYLVAATALRNHVEIGEVTNLIVSYHQILAVWRFLLYAGIYALTTYIINRAIVNNSIEVTEETERKVRKFKINLVLIFLVYELFIAQEILPRLYNLF